jgi:hypothetical protein
MFDVRFHACLRFVDAWFDLFSTGVSVTVTIPKQE